jgi:antitoxin ParD1/3/4
MDISLLPDLEAMVRRKVESGEYDSPSDLVAHALYLLDAHDRMRQLQLDDLRREIEIGIEECDRGDVVDAEVVFAELERKAARLKSPAE